MRHPLLLLSLLPLLLGTSCSLLISFFIANVSSRPIHIEYTVPCRPDCPSPTLIGVRTLKHDGLSGTIHGDRPAPARVQGRVEDRKSTRLNSSHVAISYAVFCLK